MIGMWGATATMFVIMVLATLIMVGLWWIATAVAKMLEDP